MEVYQFNLEDFQSLESLLQLSTDISNIYDKLCELEINNQKDSNIYTNLLEKLKKLVEKETKEYRKKNFTHEQCIKYLKLFESKTEIPCTDNRITISLKYNNHKIIRRIMNNLLDILNENKGFHQMVLENGIEKDISKIIEHITQKDIIKEIEKSSKIQSSLENDIHNIFLSILEESITYPSNKNHKNDLIRAKYCAIFTHKKLESLHIENNFNISNNIYTSSQMINELLQEPEISYKLLKHMRLVSMAKYDINVLLNICDKEYEDSKTSVNAILTACHIRALLSLMEQDDVYTLNQEIHDISVYSKINSI